MAIKKSELYSSLWESCDALRGGMDASLYKDYILVLLFIKYTSDKYADDSESIIEIPKGGGFLDLVELKGKTDIGDGINKVIAKLAEANGLKGIIDVADFNDSDKLGSGKEMQDKLTELIGIFQNEDLDFSKNKASGDDLLGDAYEYLMRNFATESGKSKGQFYTPAEVSRIIAKVIGMGNATRKDWTVYDPTCGSGSLLLKAAAETPKGITIYGQENDVATRALGVMNMWLHENPGAEIWRGNSLSDPYFKNADGGLKTFDFVIANPPFSFKTWTSGMIPEHDDFGRFDGYGVPPTKNGDYAFLLHVVKSIKSKGKGAIVMPHGVLFRGNVEGSIRENLINRKYIKGIIGLPSNLFYGTGIPACLIIFDKENAESRNAIFMINANDGFIKDGNKNRLRERDIHKIVDVFTNQIEIPQYSRIVPLEEISNEKNDYNLNIPRYIDNQKEEDIHDIEAHLKGGIPIQDIDDLDTYWEIYPNMRQDLFSPNERKGYLNLKPDKTEIQTIIFGHSEFEEFSKTVITTYNNWKSENYTLLNNIKIGTKPKELINTISEDILEKFSKVSLIDKYNIYQCLMTYWQETMQDDVYLLAENDWNAGIVDVKNKNGKVTGWDSELIPKEIVISKYFADRKEEFDTLNIETEQLAQELEEMEDEYGNGEEDMFSEARSGAGTITQGEIKKRIKIIKNDSEFANELDVLTKYSELKNKEKDVKSKIKTVEKKFDKELLEKYQKLTKDEIKELIIDDKWISSLSNSINEEMTNLSHNLASRIKELIERYENPLPQLANENQSLTKQVDQHLEKMGFKR